MDNSFAGIAAAMSRDRGAGAASRAGTARFLHRKFRLPQARGKSTITGLWWQGRSDAKENHFARRPSVCRLHPFAHRMIV